MTSMLLIFAAYKGEDCTFGHIEVTTGVFPPTAKLIKEAEANITKLLGCSQVIVLNWKELSSEEETVVDEPHNM